ncbi:hypothetical protein BGZ61DRAFT_370751 [Ilyonectria robusta]|uniref:uncharacterized protein n=1 Tax=Ilyonectria robusta TaxID=1079257 RepID=UPI001E8D74DD|nr:uncharacterized protein BGZ61DRAFT_370751 [Ilyonectria robusta]KAH8658974.1 hypothetical protein BGZ61DRAFT_370751 [Ilyonectria robusta]
MIAPIFRSVVRSTLTGPAGSSAFVRCASSLGRRTISTGGQNKEFLCIMPDRPNVLEIRKKVKAAHYEGIKPLIASGKLAAGVGAIFEKHPVEGQSALFKGSVVVYTGKDIAEVRKIIENDIYATSGVWDLEKTQVIPYVPAVRQPLE